MSQNVIIIIVPFLSVPSYVRVLPNISFRWFRWKKSFTFPSFLRLLLVLFSQNGREQRTDANNRRSLLMKRSNPVAKRLISNAGCANGANDYRIRHVGIIKQLLVRFSLSLSLFAMWEMRNRCGKQRMICALHSLRYRWWTKHAKSHYAGKL